MERIRVGIIGQGRSGRDIHRHLLESLPKLMERFDVVAVADPIAERCKGVEKGANPNCKIYKSHKELLQDKNIELVINASRSHRHAAFTIEALNAGFNVLCEKPFAATVAEFDEVMEAAKKNNRFVAAFQQSRFRSVFTKTREIIKSGVLGRIIQVKIFYNGFFRRWDWQTIQGMAAGNLRNTGPHPLDQALQFYGDGEADPEQIICFMDRANVSGDAEDHVKLILAGKGHPTIDMEASASNAYNPYCYQVYGTQGSLAADANTVTWKYFRPEEAGKIDLSIAPLEDANRLPVYCADPTILYYEEKYTNPANLNEFDYMGELYYLELYEALRNGKKMQVQLSHVRRQIAVIEECHRQNPFERFVEVDCD